MCQKQEAHVGHCRSPEYNERVKNLTSEWNQKQIDNAKRGIPSQGGKIDLDLWPHDPKSIGVQAKLTLTYDPMTQNQ